MINNIINFIIKYWQIIAIISLLLYLYKQRLEKFEEVDVIRAGCKSKSPLNDYINSLDDRNQNNRTTMKPIVDINVNYANIG